MPQEKPRPHGTVVTPNMTEGVLLTSQDMVDVINMNTELKAMRLEGAASRRLRRVYLREETEKAKAIKQVAAARELKERRTIRGEDAAARRVRSFRKREAAKLCTAEKHHAARLEKAAVRAERKRLKQSSDSSEQRKRRALGDIINECLV
jgi:membrane glycosyltransferase